MARVKVLNELNQFWTGGSGLSQTLITILAFILGCVFATVLSSALASSSSSSVVSIQTEKEPYFVRYQKETTERVKQTRIDLDQVNPENIRQEILRYLVTFQR